MKLIKRGKVMGSWSERWQSITMKTQVKLTFYLACGIAMLTPYTSLSAHSERRGFERLLLDLASPDFESAKRNFARDFKSRFTTIQDPAYGSVEEAIVVADNYQVRVLANIPNKTAMTPIHVLFLRSLADSSQCFDPRQIVKLLIETGAVLQKPTIGGDPVTSNPFEKYVFLGGLTVQMVNNATAYRCIYEIDFGYDTSYTLR